MRRWEAACSARKGRSLQQCTIMVHLGHALLKQYHKSHNVIRFALSGCTNRPFYLLVVACNKRARDGKYIEQLGCYDPLPNDHNEKVVAFNFDRLKYWIGTGAQLTRPVEKLLGLSGFFPLHPMTITNAERIRKERQRMATKAAKEAEEKTAEKEPDQTN
uniref:Small ribosomal subunit protein bS16m n=1 Tax=Salvator merianae TaxID=96440 RepID=A0A8D0DNS7_SALMN